MNYEQNSSSKEIKSEKEDTPLLIKQDGRDFAMEEWCGEKYYVKEHERKLSRVWKGIPLSRWLLGFGYLLVMGFCGIVFVALGSTLEDLAENCGTTSVDAGSVFVSLGAGSICGSISPAKIFKQHDGNTVICVALSFSVLCLMYMPFVSNIIMLHVCFALLGMLTTFLDTGCQIMTRKIHGQEAGPWLGANTVAFSISGAIVPLVSYISRNLFGQYVLFSEFAVVTTIYIYVSPKPLPHHIPPMAFTGKEPNGEQTERRGFSIEIILSLMMFWVVGGAVTATAYMDEFAEEKDFVDEADKSLVIEALWVAIVLGRLAGIHDMLCITLQKIYVNLTFFLIGGVCGMVIILMFPMQPLLLWIGVGIYGFSGAGPTIGYIYDLNNRMTPPSEIGMSIIMLGMNLGASLVPFATTLLWEDFGAYSLPWMIVISNAVPIPLMYIARNIFDVQGENGNNQDAAISILKE